MHKEHLTVRDYKKEQRSQEITELEDKLDDKKLEINTAANRIANLGTAEEYIRNISTENR